MDMPAFNRNEKQTKFNEIRGIITELNDGETFCSVTLECGHENKRSVNFVCKKEMFDSIQGKLCITDKVRITYYAVSRNKNKRWYTSLNILSIDGCNL